MRLQPGRSEPIDREDWLALGIAILLGLDVLSIILILALVL